jgi:type I restriction enzyme S subunit
MRKYDKYKDSGIAWIGEIPEGWETVAIKNTSKCKNGLFIDGDWIESPVITSEGIRYITTGNIGILKYKEQGNGFISEDTFNKLNCTEVFPGDLIISRLNEPIGRCCIIPNIGSRIVTAVDNVVYRPDKNKYSKLYLMYQMNCSKYSFYTSLISRGATMQRISRSMLGSIKILVPPLPEQQSIATYLDNKVGEIDGMIEKTVKKIALYEELKKSIITRAVTKGLNPHAKMKDSGVEWIGEIPEGWEVMKVKYTSNVYNGATPSTSNNSFWDGSIVWITPKDMNFTYIYDSEKKITKEGLNNCGTTLVPIGSIIMSSRAPIGKIGIAKTLLCTNQGCKSIVPINVKSKYLYYLFIHHIPVFISLGKGTTFMELSAQNIKDLKVAIPPLPEQQSIATYLDTKTTAIDSQIAIARKRIDLLKELKSSLITQVVTGKMKVC